MAKYCFVLVNYNGSEFTKEYIKSVNTIAKYSDDKIEIVVVDNHSNEEDKKVLYSLEKEYDNTKIQFLSENVGYFKGLNKGLESIKDKEDTLFIVGNNDLTFDKNFILNLKKINFSSEIFVIAPNITTKEGRQQNPHVVSNVTLINKIKSAIYFSNYYLGQSFRLLNQTIRKITKKSTPLKNDFGQMIIKRGIGACYILTPNFFKHFSKLDDRVFMWGEEALLSNQIERLGGKTLYDPTIKINHHESASVSEIQTKAKYYMIKESYNIYKDFL